LKTGLLCSFFHRLHPYLLWSLQQKKGGSDRHNLVFDISGGTNVINLLIKTTKRGDIVMVAGDVSILKKQLGEFAANGVVVISIPEE
jgi:hypothetical protein